MKIESCNQEISTNTKTLYGQSKYIGVYALASVSNELWANGAEEVHVEATVMIPPAVYKSRMNGMLKMLQRVCGEEKICLEKTKGQIASVVSLPTVCVTGVAKTDTCLLGERRKEVSSGQGIILVGWVGMSGMLQVAEEKEKELGQQFSPSFMKRVLAYRKYLFGKKPIDFIKINGEKKVTMIKQIGEGGILASLWDVAKETKLGLETDMKKFSILQETVEVCERYRLNPYQLSSVGSFLVVSEEADELAEKLREYGVQAEVIGRMTDNNDKIIQNGEEIRYIDRPAPDEIYKIFET